MSADDINGIRESHKTWGGAYKYLAAHDMASFWTTTPAGGSGLWGAESFHRQDCIYKNNQLYVFRRLSPRDVLVGNGLWSQFSDLLRRSLNGFRQ